MRVVDVLLSNSHTHTHTHTVSAVLLSDMTVAPLVAGEGEALIKMFEERASDSTSHDGFCFLYVCVCVCVCACVCVCVYTFRQY